MVSGGVWFAGALAIVLAGWVTGRASFVLLLLALWLCHAVFDRRRA